MFTGYTFADVKEQYETENRFPLVAKHRLTNVMMCEAEDKLKMGLKTHYCSLQKLNNGTTGKADWLTGFVVEKLWNYLSVFVNFETFTGTR